MVFRLNSGFRNFLCSQEMDSVLIQISQKLCVHQRILYLHTIHINTSFDGYADNTLQVISNLHVCGFILFFFYCISSLVLKFRQYIEVNLKGLNLPSRGVAAGRVCFIWFIIFLYFWYISVCTQPKKCITQGKLDICELMLSITFPDGDGISLHLCFN